MMVVFMAAVMLLLPRNLRHFADLVAIATVAVLALCYVGLLLAPQLAIHQATDFLEPEHAGSWRGAFPHKNQAGAMMAVFVFVGLFVARMRSLAAGVAIVAAAVIFLVMTRSKTPIGLLPLTLGADLAHHADAPPTRRRPDRGRIGRDVQSAFDRLGLFRLVQAILQATMSDPSFTGRSDIGNSRSANLPVVRSRALASAPSGAPNGSYSG